MSGEGQEKHVDNLQGTEKTKRGKPKGADYASFDTLVAAKQARRCKKFKKAGGSHGDV